MRCLLFAVACFACSPAFADDADRVGWLPPEIDVVMASPVDGAPLLRYLSATVKPAPPCLAQQVAALDRFYQVQQGMGSGRSLFLAHGKIDREAFERCIVDVAYALGMHIEKRTDGALSEVELGDKRAWFAFTHDWVMYDNDRERVARFAGATSGRTLRPAVATLLRRCAPGVRLCSAIAIDLTTPILGIASSGALMQVNAGATPTATATVFFADGKSAGSAVAAVRRIAADPARSDALRRFVGALAPSARGNTMLVDVAGVMALPMQTLQAVTAELGRPPAAR